jgi:hypothetical protein
MSTSLGMEATSFSEQAPSGAQGCWDAGDVVEKFARPPGGAGGNLPQRSVIVGAGDPIPAAAKIEALTPTGVVATR